MALPRSFLHLPANSERKRTKAYLGAADVVVLDLEDALALSEKEEGREAVRQFLRQPPPKPTVVRVNAMSTEYCFSDLEAAVSVHSQGIILPKVERGEDVRAVSWILSQIERQAGVADGATRLMPIIETAQGLVACAEIAAASPRVAQLAFGMIDLATNMGCDPTSAIALNHARFTIATASAAAGLTGPLDTAYPDIKDIDGLRNACLVARSLGFSGKGCIHPDQLAPVNDAFAPSEVEIASAQKVVEAFAAAEQQGLAAIVVDGKMVDYPVVARARALLATLRG